MTDPARRGPDMIGEVTVAHRALITATLAGKLYWTSLERPNEWGAVLPDNVEPDRLVPRQVHVEFLPAEDGRGRRWWSLRDTRSSRPRRTRFVIEGLLDYAVDGWELRSAIETWDAERRARDAANAKEALRRLVEAAGADG